MKTHLASKLQEPLTSCGILSTLSSVYNPLGFAAPFILEGRIIIQKLCKENSAWDETIPRRSKDEWNMLKEKLRSLERIKVARCFKPRDVSVLKNQGCKCSSFFRRIRNRIWASRLYAISQ